MPRIAQHCKHSSVAAASTEKQFCEHYCISCTC